MEPPYDGEEPHPRRRSSYGTRTSNPSTSYARGYASTARRALDPPRQRTQNTYDSSPPGRFPSRLADHEDYDDPAPYDSGLAYPDPQDGRAVDRETVVNDTLAAALAHMRMSGTPTQLPLALEEPEWSDDDLPITPKRRRRHQWEGTEDESERLQVTRMEEHDGVQDGTGLAEWVMSPQTSMGFLEKTAQWLGIPEGGRMPKLLMAPEEEQNERALGDERQLRVEEKNNDEDSPLGSREIRSQAPSAGASSVGLLESEGDEDYGDEEDDIGDILRRDVEKEAIKSREGGSEVGAEPSVKLLMPPPEPSEPPTVPMMALPPVPELPSAPEPEASSSVDIEYVDPGEDAELGVDAFHRGTSKRDVGRMAADQYFGLEETDAPQQGEGSQSGNSFDGHPSELGYGDPRWYIPLRPVQEDDEPDNDVRFGLHDRVDEHSPIEHEEVDAGSANGSSMMPPPPTFDIDERIDSAGPDVEVEASEPSGGQAAIATSHSASSPINGTDLVKLSADDAPKEVSAITAPSSEAEGSDDDDSSSEDTDEDQADETNQSDGIDDDEDIDLLTSDILSPRALVIQSVSGNGKPADQEVGTNRIDSGIAMEDGSPHAADGELSIVKGKMAKPEVESNEESEESSAESSDAESDDGGDSSEASNVEIPIAVVVVKPQIVEENNTEEEDSGESGESEDDDGDGQHEDNEDEDDDEEDDEQDSEQEDETGDENEIKQEVQAGDGKINIKPTRTVANAESTTHMPAQQDLMDVGDVAESSSEDESGEVEKDRDPPVTKALLRADDEYQRYQEGEFDDSDTDDGMGRSDVLQGSSRAASIKSARTNDSRSTKGSITSRTHAERLHGLKYPFSKYKPTTSDGRTSRISGKSRTGSLLRTSAATQDLEVDDDNRDEDDLESDVRGESTAGTSVRFEEASTSRSTGGTEHRKRRRRQRRRTDQEDETTVGEASRRRAHRSSEEVSSSAVSSNPLKWLLGKTGSTADRTKSSTGGSESGHIRRRKSSKRTVNTNGSSRR